MLMTAGLIRGTKITICAEGSDAQEAVNRIYSLIDDYGLGADEAWRDLNRPINEIKRQLGYW